MDATDTSSKNKRESNLSSYYVKSFYTPRSKLALKIRQEKNKESNEMEKWNKNKFLEKKKKRKGEISIALTIPGDAVERELY